MERKMIVRRKRMTVTSSGELPLSPSPSHLSRCLHLLSSSSEEESETGEEGGALDDSVCPAGCDPALFSLACTLRESRLDVEEALVEEKKATELARKELEASRKKLKTMESHVKTAQAELEVHNHFKGM